MRLADHKITIDESLLERAAQGDETAFVQLYQRHRDAVFRFAYRLTGTAEAAEDIAHDCFMSLLQRPDGYDARRATLRTYLLAAARNLARKRFRQQGALIAEDDAGEPPASDNCNPLSQLLAAESAGEVRRAVLALPLLQREALILFEYEQLPLAEVAAVTGADVNTVKGRLHRARQNLKRTLAPYWYGSRALAQEVRQ